MLVKKCYYVSKYIQLKITIKSTLKMNLNRIREKMIVYCIHVVKRTAHKNIKRGIYIPVQKDYLYFSLCKKKNYSAKKFISSVDKKKTRLEFLTCYKYTVYKLYIYIMLSYFQGSCQVFKKHQAAVKKIPFLFFLVSDGYGNFLFNVYEV